MNLPNNKVKIEWTAFVVLILAAALAYLPLAAQLGYYHDDWFTVAARISGTTLSQMHSIDRPLMGQLYDITHRALGDAPLNWHLYAFGLRLAGGLVFYWLLRMLWPRQRFATLAMALLFLVYPGFLQQVSANNYSNHLASLALAALSLALTVRALRTPRPWEAAVYVILSAALVLVYPRLYETMIGVEGLRFALVVYLVWRGCELKKSLSAEAIQNFVGRLPMFRPKGVKEEINGYFLPRFAGQKIPITESSAPPQKGGGRGEGQANSPFTSNQTLKVSKTFRVFNPSQLLTAGIFYLPYLITTLIFLYWRLFHFKSVRTATDTQVLLEQFRSDPVGVLLKQGLAWGIDCFETVFSAWVVPLMQRTVALNLADTCLALLLAAAAAGLVWVAWRASGTSDAQDKTWALEALVIGALGTLAGLLPVALSGRDVQFRYNLDRYTLQSMMGAVIFLVGLVYLVLRQPRFQFAVLTLLAALGVATHTLNAVHYRDYWEMQRQFWWQLTWRVPQLKDGTALVVVLPDGFELAEGFEIWAPANFIYSPVPAAPRLTGEILDGDTIQMIEKGAVEERDFRTIQFKIDFSKTLGVALSSPGVCLHVLDGWQAALLEAQNPLLERLARASHPGQIETSAVSVTPPAELFGAEPPHGWCWTYQQAALAAQRQDWQSAARLGDDAQRLGLSPQDVSEWLPFYEAYQQLGRQDDVARIKSIFPR